MTSIPAPDARLESPCIKVCVLNADSICVGCGRTIEEIANWPRMSAEAQRTVCTEAAARLNRRSN